MTSKDWYEAQKLMKLTQPAGTTKTKRPSRKARGASKFADAVAEWTGDELVWPGDELRALLQRESTEPLPAVKLLSALRSAGLLNMTA